MNFTEHIRTCVNKAIKNIKILNGDIMKLNHQTVPHPMSTRNSQFLLNLICKLPNKKKTKYLEIGVLRGASYFAAAYNNTGVFYGIDNWSRYFQEDSEENINKNIEKYSSSDRKFVFFVEDCWELDLKKIKDKINVFFYDGDHSYESHSKILTHYDSVLDDDIILIVDDYYHPGNVGENIQNATEEAIKNSNFKKVTEFFIEKHIDWHNGFCITHLRRQNA